jgi:hypothetical protein
VSGKFTQSAGKILLGARNCGSMQMRAHFVLIGAAAAVEEKPPVAAVVGCGSKLQAGGNN